MKFFLGKRAFSRHAPELSELGYAPCPIEPLAGLNPIVADHADTLIFECGRLLSAIDLPDTEFIPASVKPFGDYPDDVKLNALVLGGCLFGRLASLSPELLALADEHRLTRVNVRQGYTRCSVLPLYSENGSPGAAVTADKRLAAAMREKGIEVLEITPGHIALEGCEYGFIGGASAVDRIGRRVIFYGSLAHHPDGDKIHSFCSAHDYAVIELSGELTDLGGGVLVH